MVSADDAGAAAVVPQQVVHKLDQQCQRLKAESSDETVHEAQVINDAPIPVIQAELHSGQLCPCSVVHVADVLPPVPPPKLVNHKRALGEDGEVILPLAAVSDGQTAGSRPPPGRTEARCRVCNGKFIRQY